MPLTYELPAYWASALINGDYSGLDSAETKQLNEWLESEGYPRFVSCSDESYFSHSNDATDLGGDVLRFYAY